MMDTGASDQARQEGLWGRAAGWRNLTIAASFLTFAAVALPVLLPQPQDVNPAPQNPPVKRIVMAPTEPAPAVTPPLVPAATVSHTTGPVHMAALAHPRRSPMPAAPACALRQPTAPFPMGLGTILGFESPAQAQADIPRREARLGGAIDPDYVSDLRAMVRQDDGRVQAFDVPRGLAVHIGDRVTLQDSYRNMAQSCSYVPILITADSGPASQTGAVPDAQESAP